MKKVISLLIALIVIVSLGVPELSVGSHMLPTTVQAAESKMNKKYAYLKVGDTVKLTVKDVSGKVTWASDNTDVATVKKGVVKAKSEGKAVVTATINGKTYYSNVFVNKIELNYVSTDLSKGQVMELKLAGIPGKDVKWSSSDKKIVTVDKNGKIKGRKGGQATIQAIYKNVTYKCEVNVIGKEILVFSNEDIDVYYYFTSISTIDKALYDKSDAPDDDFMNVVIKFRVYNKMDREISCYIQSIRLNDINADDNAAGENVLPNSIKTIVLGGFIDPYFPNDLDVNSFVTKKISGDVVYYVGHDKAKEHFSKKIN